MKPITKAGLERIIADRNIELRAVIAQRDELRDAMKAYFDADSNEERIPGVTNRLHDAEVRCKTILAQTVTRNPQPSKASKA